ncbi:S41 family peptidase [Ferruginibacter sp. SUN106]|uniref:S41 family peptidase n=1 Tax=Ferruginibacter sp. SUN106 TaxID=2978348 RepID=UPI003D36C769
MKRISLLPVFLLFVFSAHAQLPDKISPADKVYGLSKFWQEVNYNFIYLDKVDRKQWDSAYKAMIVSVQKTTNDYAYFRELQKFCALLKDGHTNVYFPQDRAFETMTTMFGDYRFFIENIDGKAIIVRTNLSKKDEIPVGSEVIEVNGKPTPTYINEDVAPYISSSTSYVLQDWSINGLLKGLDGDSYAVKIKRPNGSIVSLNLVHKRTEEKEVYPAFDVDRNLMDFKWQNDKVAYVALNSFDDEKIDSLFIDKLPELYKAKGLIIDLRYNGGGSTGIGTAILQYLTNDTILYGSKNRSRLHIPSFKAWGKFTNVKDTTGNEWAKKSWLSFNDKYYYNFDYEADTVHLAAKRIVVPTVILLGHNTASAAEDFLIYADNQKHMIKMGVNSFGSTGQPYMFDLPGGGSARVCTKQDTYPDGREFVGYGIKPDIEVKPTLTDYLQKKDPVINKAMEYLKTKIK